MSTRQRVIFAVMMLVAVAWAIDGMTPRAEGVAFSVDRHTASTVGTKDAKVPQSGIPGKAGKGLLFPAENLKGRSAGDFLTPDGRFDLKAIQSSGYQGPLDLKGLDVATDPRTGEPVLSPSAITKRVEGKGTLDQQVGFDVGIEPRTGEPVLSAIANARIHTDPDDTSFWTDRFSCFAGVGGGCHALCVYDGKLIAGGWVPGSELRAGNMYCFLGRLLLVSLGVGDE
jgi:hypothetical protein